MGKGYEPRLDLCGYINAWECTCVRLRVIFYVIAITLTILKNIYKMSHLGER